MEIGIEGGLVESGITRLALNKTLSFDKETEFDRG
jgi:hypothetical protein